MIKLLKSDGVTSESTKDVGTLAPGSITEIVNCLQNTGADTIKDIYAEFFNNMKDDRVENISGKPVLDVIVKRCNHRGIPYTTLIEETSANAEFVSDSIMPKILRKSSSGTYTELSSYPITLLSEATEKILIGFNYIVKNLSFTLSTLGVYTDFLIKFSNGSDSYVSPVSGFSDGTSGNSQSGIIFFGAIDETMWKKQKEDGFNMYWIELSCSTVTTPAVATSIIQKYVLKNINGDSGFYKSAEFYRKSGSTYTLYTPAIEYLNKGIIVYDSDPFGGGTYTIFGRYYRKNPAPGEYTLTFQTSPLAVIVNSGSPVEIIADGNTYNEDIIPGIDVKFNTTITSSSQALITILDVLKYIDYAKDDGSGNAQTYQNKDMVVVDQLTSNSVGTFHWRFNFPIDISSDTNQKALKYHFEATQ